MGGGLSAMPRIVGDRPHQLLRLAGPCGQLPRPDRLPAGASMPIRWLAVVDQDRLEALLLVIAESVRLSRHDPGPREWHLLPG